MTRRKRARPVIRNGLLLAEYQGKLFEQSIELNCYSAIFMRRFLHSDLLSDLDEKEVSLLSLDVQEAIQRIQNQFGPTEYGKVKFSKGSLFWIGYLYRYIAYTREQPTRFVMKLFPYKELNNVYFVYHTQDPEWCISSLLSKYGLTEDIFDNNLRMKDIIRQEAYAT